MDNFAYELGKGLPSKCKFATITISVFYFKCTLNEYLIISTRSIQLSLNQMFSFQTKSVLQIAVFGNITFLVAISASILAVFGLIYVPFLQSIFQTEALSFEDIVTLVAISSSVLFVDELVKLVLRTMETRGLKKSWNVEGSEQLIP